MQHVGFTVRYAAKVFSNNFQRPFQYLVAFTPMNSDIDWMFAFIEIVIGMHPLLKGMIGFIYSGSPKYSKR